MSRPRTSGSKLPAYVRINHGSYQYKGKSFCRVEEGEAIMREKHAALVHMGNGAQSTNFVEVIEEYKRTQMLNIKDTTRVSRCAALTKIAGELAEYDVADVLAADVEKTLELFWLDKGFRAQAHFARSALSGFFSWCVVRKNLRRDNPCREVKLPQVRGKKSPWTPELFHAVRDRFRPMMQCYHDLSVLLYQRTTEVRALKRSDIKDGMIYVKPTKTAKSTGAAVYIPVTPEIQEVLDRAAAISKAQGVVSPFVIHMKDGRPMKVSTVRFHYTYADERLHPAGRVGLNARSLRAFAATMAINAGYSLRDLQTGLVHSKQATTEHYIQEHHTPVSTVKMALPVRTAPPAIVRIRGRK